MVVGRKPTRSSVSRGSRPGRWDVVVCVCLVLSGFLPLCWAVPPQIRELMGRRLSSAGRRNKNAYKINRRGMRVDSLQKSSFYVVSDSSAQKIQQVCVSCRTLIPCSSAFYSNRNIKTVVEPSLLLLRMMMMAFSLWRFGPVRNVPSCRGEQPAFLRVQMKKKEHKHSARLFS